jgi:3-methyladenine DNA glycosylase AlkD
MYQRVIEELKKSGDENFALHHSSFFKAFPGGYGEGDHFLGLKVPQIKKVASTYYRQLTYDDITVLITSKWHEVRLLALVVMQRLMSDAPRDIYNIYIQNISSVNNWDLVDLSAPNIPAPYWLNTDDYSLMWEYANSGKLWLERITLVSTLYNLRKHKDCRLTIELAKQFNDHKHDLIHKAAGWVLREAGKVDKSVLINYLNEYAVSMPRTALRYSIEQFSSEERTKYLNMKKLAKIPL